MDTTVPAPLRKLSAIVQEYDDKLAAIEAAAEAFDNAASTLKMASTIGGTWGDVTIDTGHIYVDTLKSSLLKSAWRHVYKGLNIETVAPVSDKQKFEKAMADPAPFTLENIRATFGDYIQNPMGNILRGLAEVFCQLDPAYKSHDKVKIGVQGLPKRIIIGGLNGYSGYGRDRIRDVLNALGAYQGKGLVTYQELAALEMDGDCLRQAGVLPKRGRYEQEEERTVGRGVWLRKFKNGNGHLFFDNATLKDINRALADYYGDVLPDCHEEKPTQKRASTEVSKDLQYYPTSAETVERVLMDLYLKDKKVLEPSCGCGRILDGIKKQGGKGFGVEVDAARVREAQAKGHRVQQANFLALAPVPEYDEVVMNPPFYGKHYFKHVMHALKFLKPNGKLTAILPVTARYDHGLFDGVDCRKIRWHDLPVGSFKEAGTNINTTVLTLFN